MSYEPNGRGELGKGEMAILTAIAQHSEGVSREQLTVLTGYKRSSRDTYLQRLSARNLISIGASITATHAGIAVLGSNFRPLPKGAELRDHWLKRLPAGEASILAIAIEHYPKTVERDWLSDKTGYKRSSRDTYIQRLTARRLLDSAGPGAVVASKELF